MKKFLIFCITVFVFSGCSQEELQPKSNEAENASLDVTCLDDPIYDKATNQIMALFARPKLRKLSVDSLESVELECQEILSPLVSNGEQLQEELLEFVESGTLELTQEEQEMLEEMTDEELAAFSYYMHAITDTDTDTDIDLGEAGSKIKYTTANVIDCISVATGVDAIMSIIDIAENTAALITARTAWQVARICIKRYLGWVGLACAIYDFSNCMISHR